MYIQYRSAIFFINCGYCYLLFHTRALHVYWIDQRLRRRTCRGRLSGGTWDMFCYLFFFYFLFVCVLLVLFIAFSIGPLPIVLNTLGKIQLKVKRRNTGHSFALCDVGDIIIIILIIIIIIIVNDYNNNHTNNN